MDIETSEAIDSVRSEIGRVEGSLRTEIGRVETSLRGDIEKLGHTLRGEMSVMRDELKRHTDMRIEDVRDDIRILAEGFASLSERIDRLAK